MSRAPFVMPKAGTAFARDNAIYDTTIGWRFVNAPDDAEHVNPNDGAIALGHPLGMSARLAITALINFDRMNARLAVCTMCIGVGQGIAMLLGHAPDGGARERCRVHFFDDGSGQDGGAEAAGR
jgi:acetyl-CoA acetyltransferase